MRGTSASAAAVLILLGTTAIRGDSPSPSTDPFTIKPLISADLNSAGQPIVFPQKNGHVTAAVYEISPGAVLPVHKHPFPRLAYVLAGTLRVTNMERKTSAIYQTGSFVLESVGLWHEGSNVGQDKLRLLVIDLSEKGMATTIMKR